MSLAKDMHFMLSSFETVFPVPSTLQLYVQVFTACFQAALGIHLKLNRRAGRAHKMRAKRALALPTDSKLRNLSYTHTHRYTRAHALTESQSRSAARRQRDNFLWHMLQLQQRAGSLRVVVVGHRRSRFASTRLVSSRQRFVLVSLARFLVVLVAVVVVVVSFWGFIPIHRYSADSVESILSCLPHV